MERTVRTPWRVFAAVGLVIVAVAVVGLVALLNKSSLSPTGDKQQSAQVDHWHAMQAARERYFGTPEHVDEVGGAVGYGDEDAWKEYVYHRDTLVRAGRIAHEEYAMCNLTAPTAESEHFLHLLLDSKCPSIVDFSSPYTREQKPLTIEVWCRPELVLEWRRFIDDHNILKAEYRSRFMTERRGQGGNSIHLTE